MLEEQQSQCSTNMVSPQRLWGHHRTLCREIGPRLLGTESDRRAAGYIESHFARCGLVTRRQEYPCPSWEHKRTLITASDGFTISPPEGGACMFSAPCDLRGELVVLETAGALEQSELRGKIALFTGELAAGEFRSESSPLYQIMIKKKPVALIVVDKRKDTYNTKTVRVPTLNIPVCAVSARSGERLRQERGEVSVLIEARRFDSRSWNVFGATPCAAGKRIRVVAHYDTPSDSPGSKDNGSGTSVIMEVAEALQRSGHSVPVEFIAFGGEEYAGLGALEYQRAHSDEIDNTCLVINCDSLGCCGTDSQVFFSGELENVTAALKYHIAAVGGYHALKLGEVPQNSDHVRFQERGVPAVLVHDTQPYFHHSPLDIPRFMSLERLEDAARIVLGVILDCAP